MARTRRACVSAESGLPTTWSARENVAWSAELRGRQLPSPIVWGDQVFVTSQVGRLPLSGASHPALARDDAELVSREKPIGGRREELVQPGHSIALVVESFNRLDGRRLWEYRVRHGVRIQPSTKSTTSRRRRRSRAASISSPGSAPASSWHSTCAVEWCGRSTSGGVLAIRHQLGHGSSPVLYKDLLILLCDHASALYMVALEARTGKLRWKADRGKGQRLDSTPLIVPGPRGDELLVNSSERIDGYDPATGELLWYADAPRQTPIPSAVFYDGLIYMTRGYRNSPYLALRPGGRGDVRREPCGLARAGRRLVRRVARRV